MSEPTTLRIENPTSEYALEVFTTEGQTTWVMRLRPNGEITFNLDELTVDEAAMQVIEKIQQFTTMRPPDD